VPDFFRPRIFTKGVIENDIIEVMARFSPREKAEIIERLERAKSTVEGHAILEEVGVSAQTAYKWRVALRKGSLGAKRGRKTDPVLDQELAKIDVLPEVLSQVRVADPDLATCPEVPTPLVLKKDLLETIVNLVDDEEVEWKGDDSPGWHERVKVDMKSRVSRMRAAAHKGGGPTIASQVDYLGSIHMNTPEEFCRHRDCPCTRLCKVPHIHAFGHSMAPSEAGVDELRPVKLVCLSAECTINRYCCASWGNPLHVHWPKADPVPRLGEAKPIREWTTAEDCPWHDACDVLHTDIDGSEMEVVNAVQDTWHPVRLWCVDPVCPHHRRGQPHVHCRKCGALWPAWVRYHEMDLTRVARLPAEDTIGLCEKCYFEWKASLPDATEK
jgi:transposase-like protein